VENVKFDLLKVLFRIKGVQFVPYDPFKLVFEQVPDYLVIKSGRQVSKTTSGLIFDLIRCITCPSFYLLIVLPLESQAARISSEFLKPILDNSPIFNIIKFDFSTLKVHFENRSTIEFSYTSTAKAVEDVRRIRSISADAIHFDEVQDIPYGSIPVILECLSASKYGYTLFTGTPKNMNNTLQFLWDQTTCHEWVIRCDHCGHHNICEASEDLLKIIGPYRDDISYEKPGTICSKCSKIIYPQKGTWVAKYPDRQKIGLHVPQVIIPIHYANPKNWLKLLSKKNLEDGYTIGNFYREVLGESYDIAARLVTLSDMVKVCTLGNRDKSMDELRQWMSFCRFTAFGIDWGGGGEEGNYTTIALVGLTHNGTIEVPWAYESPTPHDHIGEAKMILHLFNELQPNVIAHDYSGAGALRETILIQNGIPFHRIQPFRYVGNQGVAVKAVSGLPNHPRPFYQIDPNKCLLYVIGSVKQGTIRFFNDLNSPTSLTKHFLSLIDENAGDFIERYRIKCEPGSRDEFVHSVMLGCLSIWNNFGYPNFPV